jgi:hypothetical protein
MAEQENKVDELPVPLNETVEAKEPANSGWGGWFSTASVINTGWSVVNNLGSTLKETTKELFGKICHSNLLTNDQKTHRRKLLLLRTKAIRQRYTAVFVFT